MKNTAGGGGGEPRGFGEVSETISLEMFPHLVGLREVVVPRAQNIGTKAEAILTLGFKGRLKDQETRLRPRL